MRRLAMLLLAPLAACAETPAPSPSPTAIDSREGAAEPYPAASPGRPMNASPPAPALDPDTPISAPATTSAPTDPAEPGCALDRAQRYVGRQATSAVRAEVAAAVGNRTIRWIGPGDAVTMDYSESRLNMMLDAAGTITAAKCG